MLFLLIVPSLHAQEEDDEPLPPPKRAGSVKIGGAAGFTQGILFVNVDPVNVMMRRENLGEFSKDGLLMLGGSLYGYIGLVPNLRIGGSWASGSMKSVTLNGNAVREVKLSSNYGGVTLDYVVPLMPRLDVSAGVLLGGGGMDLEFSRSYGIAQTWDNTWDDFGGTAPVGEYAGKLSGSFFVYQPSVTFEVAVLRWLGVRAGASYLGMAGSSWKRDDRFDEFGVPDDVKGKGWMLNGGLYIGTFVF
jgi:hypothetical protein